MEVKTLMYTTDKKKQQLFQWKKNHQMLNVMQRILENYTL